MTKPPRKHRAAVRAVMLERKRFRQLVADVKSIDVLMQLNDPNAAPSFVIQATGAPTTGVTEAARLCERVGKAYRAMGSDLADVDLPDKAKRRLRLALAEQAAAWETRGEIWGAAETVDPDAALRRIDQHTRAAAQGFAATRRYLPSPEKVRDVARSVS